MLKRSLSLLLILTLLLIPLASCNSTKDNEPLTAYEIAVANGFEGTVDEWLESLKSPSTYEIAVANGFEGTVDEWLESLKSQSAYEIAVENGFEGTVDEWLESLKSPSAYEIALEQGFNGTIEEWLEYITPDTVAVNLGNLFDNNFDKNGYIDPYTGEEKSSDSLKYTSDYYAFDAGTLFYKANKQTSTIVFIIYDTNKNYVGYHSFNESTNSICSFGFSGYFRCYIDRDYDGQIYLSNNVPGEEVDYSYSITRVPSSTYNQTKLTVVNFGDSIFGNVQNSSSISAYMQRISGNRIYNFGFGGTTMGPRENEDWNTLAFYSLVDAICDRDFSAQDTALYGTTYFPSYFRSTLSAIKSVNFNDVDVITIAYGTNDYKENVPLSGEEFDPSSYIGAFQYAIKRLQQTYPHIRIIAITPILRIFEDGTSDTYDPCGNGTLIDFKDALLETAAKMRIPTVNSYDELSLSEYNRDLYYQTDDGTHLNERGRAMYASLINAKITEVCADLTVTPKNKVYGE